MNGRALLTVGLVLFSAGPALAHGGHIHGEPASFVAWFEDPRAAALLAVSGGLYAAGLVRLWRRAGFGRGIRPWQAGCFAAGWLSLVLTLCSPVAGWSEGLFVAHMSEHELMMVLLAAAVGGWAFWNTDRHHTEFRAALMPGDPRKAPVLLRRYGCAACHVIPGVRGATGRVGPSLEDVGQRVYLAGQFPNTPENLVRWIREPRSMDPRTAMPQTGISSAEAQDVAAYLLEN